MEIDEGELAAVVDRLPGSATFTGGLRAPICYLAAERPDARVSLWLEDASDGTPAARWPLERYGVAARHLGRAQGEFLGQRLLPDEPWLSHDWLRAYLPLRDGDLELLDDTVEWSKPRVADFLAIELAEPLRRMRADRDVFLAAMDRLPRTICHLDLHPANLFSVGDQTVLVDWAFVGVGALGEDAGNLVPDAVLDFLVRTTDQVHRSMR